MTTMFPRAIPATAPPRPYTVSELLAEVAGSLRSSWRDIAVVGEVSRWEVRGGHGYFSLKDRTGCLNGIIFASDLALVPFRVTTGLEIVVRGSLDLFAPQGRFQIKAWGIEPVGAGALQLAFEQLKAKLAAEGLFDASRKRRIPALPSRIAIVTSPTGAAIRDILNILRRRHDGLAITIYPVRVQGDGSVADVAEGIRRLNSRGGFDVLIVARGGGSPEDLAPFNDERVARALAASRIPTVSAIGHETDVTIADLVADLRAPTPSAAAELVVERKDALVRRLSDCRARLVRAVRSRLGLARGRLVGLSRAEGLLRFRYKLRESQERVGQARLALVSALERRPREYAGRLRAAEKALAGFARIVELPRRRDRVARLTALLEERVRRVVERRRERLRQDSAKLEILSPLAVLARGYAVAFKESGGAPLLSASSVRPGDRIRVRLHQGELKALVRERAVPRAVGEGLAPPAPSTPAPKSASLPLFDYLFEDKGNG
jgi:exodeoxyribonuclease VII large subunit